MTRTDTASNMPMTAFLMGSLLGVAAGLLFAPKSGRENREALGRSARDNFGKMQQKARQSRDAATAKMDEAIDQTKDVITLGGDAAEDAKVQLDAAKPGKHTIL